MPTRAERWGGRLCLFGLVLLLAVGLWQCRAGWPVSADLLSLLPRSSQDGVLNAARDRTQAPVRRQIVAVVGASDSTQAVDLADAVGRQWQASGVFEQVRVRHDVELDAWRRTVLAGRVAMSSLKVREMLRDRPGDVAAARARDIIDPFAAAGLVPVSSDWLGLGHRIERSLQPQSSMQYDLGSGTLQTARAGQTWVMVHAITRGDAFDAVAASQVAAVVDSARAVVLAQGGDWRATGGALFAAHGQARASQESLWIGVLSTLGIVAVMWLAWRRWRALLALIPVLAGLLAGAVTTIALFGTLHVLTLAVGVSLIGVAIDFPIHWLGKRYGMPRWRAWPAMRRVRPGLTISLWVTVLGYLALLFTPFIALTQIAVFSTAGLVAAYLTTVYVLPPAIGQCRLRTFDPLLRGVHAVLGYRARLAARPRIVRAAGVVVLTMLCAAGLARVTMQDDLRQWVSAPQALLDAARDVSDITGFRPTSQFVLVRAQDEDTLLVRTAAVATLLEQEKHAGRLVGYLALSQIVAPPDEQAGFRMTLAALADDPTPLQPLVDAGVPAALLRDELVTLASLPTMDIETALAAPAASLWQPLWLGRIDGQAAAVVTLTGISNTSDLAARVSTLESVQWVDETGDLNALFAQTRTTALELKVLSYVAAGALLAWWLGVGAACRILVVPIVACLATVATLGWLGQPVTLFSLFGLFLVSAIGVDYGIFMRDSVAGEAATLVGIGLGALTTLFSFGMLALSTTPAVASFGLSVSLGVVFSLVATPWVSAWGGGQTVRALAWLGGTCALVLLTGCATPPFTPAVVPDIELPRMLRAVEHQPDGGSRELLLVVQHDGPQASRWLLMDALGVPVARQTLAQGVWRNDGFLPPDAAATTLFATLVLAWTPREALDTAYGTAGWAEGDGPDETRWRAFDRTREARPIVYWHPPSSSDVALSVVLENGVTWRLSPLETPP